MTNPSLSHFPRPSRQFRVVAIVAAFNEGDVIYHVIRDLVENGVEVYLMDHHSTDDTVAEAGRWLGKGLLHIERFPEESGYPARNGREFVLADQMRRKEDLARQLDADWFMHADADEFRENPWPGMTLSEAFRWVDSMGFNAVNFDLLNFRPTDDGFIPRTDVREHLTFWEAGDPFDAVQIKAWKKTAEPVRLANSAGHEAEFSGRRVFPVPFLLRHYPIRGETHGRKKLFAERLNRFAPEEKALGWHVQYDSFRTGEARFLRDSSTLISYDPHAVRSSLLSRVVNEFLLWSAVHGPEWICSPLDGEALCAWLGRVLGRPPVPLPEVRRADELIDELLRETAKNRNPVSVRLEASSLPLLKEVARIKAAAADLEGDPLLGRRLRELEGQVRIPEPSSQEGSPALEAARRLSPG